MYLLNLGFISIMNCLQQDINIDKSMSNALKSKTEFFKSHLQYWSIALKNGTKHLAKKLNQVYAIPFACVPTGELHSF